MSSLICFLIWGRIILLDDALRVRGHGLLSLVLPGSVLLTWRSFLLGLIESLG